MHSVTLQESKRLKSRLFAETVLTPSQPQTKIVSAGKKEKRIHSQVLHRGQEQEPSDAFQDKQTTAWCRPRLVLDSPNPSNPDQLFPSPSAAPEMALPLDLRHKNFSNNDKNPKMSGDQDHMAFRREHQRPKDLQEHPMIPRSEETSASPQHQGIPSPALNLLTAQSSTLKRHRGLITDGLKSKLGRRKKRKPKISLPPLYVFIRNLLHNNFYNPQVVNFTNILKAILCTISLGSFFFSTRIKE